MYCIIPLAGPDFYHSNYGIKPLFKIDGEVLLKKITNSRPWVSEIKKENFIFVLKQSQYLSHFKGYLKEEFSDAKIVEISHFSKGALMSCLAATSLISDFNQPIAIDLADIFFNLKNETSISHIFSTNDNIGAILPVFESDNIEYSYADVKNGFVLSTKEKKGWDFGKENKSTGMASAGVYFFRNLEIFLKAAANSVKNFDLENHKGNLFVCPSVNGVNSCYKTMAMSACDVDPVSLMFKQSNN